MGQNLFDNYLLQSLIQFSGSDSDREAKTEEVFSQLCRTCLFETADNNFESNFLIDSDGKVTTVSLKEMVEMSTGIMFDMEDKLPHHMCNNCLQAVEAAFAFRNQCQQIDEVLKGLLPSKEAPAVVTEADCKTEVIQELEAAEVIQVRQQINDCQVSFVVDGLTEPINEPCSLCDETFPNDTELEAHMAESHPSKSKRKLFKCGICSKEYIFRNGLHNHMAIAHTEKKEIKCNICLRKFKKQESLRAHKNRHCVPPIAVSRLKKGPAKVILHPVLDHETFDDLHIEIKNFSCSLCDKTFDFEVEFLDHLPHHKTRKCTLCKKNFSRPKFLEGHIWSHGFERPFICPICQKGFQTSWGLRGHIKGHNQSDLSQKKAAQERQMLRERVPEKVFLHLKEPDDCTLKIENDVDLKESDDSKQTIKSYAIKSEDKQLQILANAPIEEKIVIKEEIIIEGHSQFSCKIINEPMTDEEPLQDPTEAIELDNFSKFACEVKDCEMEFKYYTGMINHYTYQHCKSPAPFKCPVCLEEYPSKSELREHLRSHLKCEYNCPYCARVYPQLYELNAHIRTHTGERPFKCSKCPKAFKHRPALRVHLKTHNDSKEFKCTICNRAFFSHNGKFLHMKSHEVNTDLQCQFCKRQFPIKSRLQRHQNGICKARIRMTEIIS